jgi:hypothetical protein
MLQERCVGNCLSNVVYMLRDMCVIGRYCIHVQNSMSMVECTRDKFVSHPMHLSYVQRMLVHPD